MGSRIWIGLVGLASLGIGLAGLVTALEHGILRLQDPPLSRYPIQGLDVSHHQGPIDWPQVAGHGRFRFVWIKATEGGDWHDPRFGENWRGARDAGLVPGAYHFFTLCTPGAVQAAHFLSVLPREPGPTLPPAVDLELGGNCAARPDRSALRREITAFLDAVRAATGRDAALYLTHEFHRAYLQDALPDNPVWLRDVFFEPGELDGRPWQVWQYLPRGRVPGIVGPVDQNAFWGDAGAFERFLQPAGPL